MTGVTAASLVAAQSSSSGSGFDPSWLAAGAAVVSALFAALGYFRQRRAARSVAWQVEVRRVEGEPGAWSRRQATIVVTNVGERVAKSVIVETDDGVLKPLSATPDVHPRGHLVLVMPPRAVGGQRLPLRVSWAGRFGRRRTWSTSYD